MPYSRALLDLLLLVLASPVYLVRFAWRAWCHCRYLRAATAPAIACSCGERIELVGNWRCGCGFTYRGHVLASCPICGRVPAMVRCYECGLTTRLPEPVWQ